MSITISVRVEDSEENEEGNFNIVGKTSYHLKKGDNYKTVQQWNITEQKYESFNPNIPKKYWDGFCDFTKLEQDNGYFIDIKNGYPDPILTIVEG